MLCVLRLLPAALSPAAITSNHCLPQNNIKGYRYQLWCIARQVGQGLAACLDVCRCLRLLTWQLGCCSARTASGIPGWHPRCSDNPAAAVAGGWTADAGRAVCHAAANCAALRSEQNWHWLCRLPRGTAWCMWTLQQTCAGSGILHAPLKAPLATRSLRIWPAGGAWVLFDAQLAMHRCADARMPSAGGAFLHALLGGTA